MDFLEQELCHHGIKGQKWGVRRYQNADGSLTAKGRVHWGVGGPRRGSSETSGKMSTKSSTKASTNPKTSSKDVSGASGSKSHSLSEEDKAKRDKAIKTALLIGGGVAVAAVAGYAMYKTSGLDGKRIAESALKNATFDKSGDVTFNDLVVNRIQTSKDFNKDYAFFATHDKGDSEFYKGMFGNELKTRFGKDTPVYQLTISAKSPISLPSEKNASSIFNSLCTSNSEFMTNAAKSIEHASTQMKRPSQRNVFDAAKKALNKNPSAWTDNDVKNLYTAFNMSLVHHEDFENKAQDAFYSALKQKGYSGIRDLNDARFSSYHRKDPIILFDTDKFILQSVTGVSNEEIEQIRNRVLPKYIAKDVAYNIGNAPEATMNTLISEVQSRITKDVKKNL